MSGSGRFRILIVVLGLLLAGMATGVGPARADELIHTVTTQEPLGVAVDGATGLVYATSQVHTGLNVIDPSTGSVVDTIAMPGTTWAITIDSTARKAYVSEYANMAGDEVYVVDLVTGTFVQSVSGFATPFAVAVDPDRHRLYVPNFMGMTLTVVDTESLATVATVDLGVTSSPTQAVLDPVTDRLFVSLQTQADSIAVLDLSTNAVIGRLDGRVTYLLAVDSANHRLYGSAHGTSRVQVFDTRTLALASEFAVGNNESPRGQVVDARNSRLYVAAADGVHIVSTTAGSLIETIELPGDGPWMLAADPSHRTVVASDVFGDRVWIMGGPYAQFRDDELVFRKSMTDHTTFLVSAGLQPVEVTGFSVTGPDADRFHITDSPCPAGDLPATGEECRVTVRVDWTDARTLSAELVADVVTGQDSTLPLRTVLDEASPAPDPAVPPVLPTPSPTTPPAPTPVTTLTVSARPHRKALPLAHRTPVVRRVVSNGRVAVHAKCLLHGAVVPKRWRNDICGARVVRPKASTLQTGVVAARSARVAAAPTCSAARVRVSVRAQASGADAKVWTRTWRSDASPRVKCRLPGTG